MARFAWLLLLPLVACATAPADKPKSEGGYAGIVQKVFRVVRRGSDLPGMSLLGKVGSALGSALRQNTETHQYVVRTPRGQVIAQSDEDFPVGACWKSSRRATVPAPRSATGKRRSSFPISAVDEELAQRGEQRARFPARRDHAAQRTHMIL